MLGDDASSIQSIPKKKATQKHFSIFFVCSFSLLFSREHFLGKRNYVTGSSSGTYFSEKMQWRSLDDDDVDFHFAVVAATKLEECRRLVEL